jgi:hypothetical protein
MKFSAEASFAGVQGQLWAPSSFFECLDVVERIMYTFHRDWTWYALSDSAVEGRWAVMTGPYIGTDMFELIPWEKGEPNGGTGENCAAVQPGYSWAIDIACGWLLKYIIEFKCSFGQRFNDQGTACIGMLESGCLFAWVFMISWCRLQFGLQQQFRGWRLVARSLQQLRSAATLVSCNRWSARHGCVRISRTWRVLHLLQKLDEP